MWPPNGSRYTAITGICLLWFGSLGPAKAAELPVHIHSLAETELLALEYSAALKSGQFALDSLRYEQEQLKDKAGWELRADYSYYQRGRGLYRDDPWDLAQTGGLTLAYPLWESWYKSKHYDQEKRTQIEEQRARVELDRLELLHQVRQFYWLARQYGYLKKQAAAHIAELEKLTNKIQARWKYGFCRKADWLEAEGRLLGQRNQLQQLEQFHDHYLQSLSQLAGEGIHPAQSLPTSLNLPPLETVKVGLKCHPALQVLDSRAKQEEVRAETSRYQGVNVWAESGVVFQAFQDNHSDTDMRLGLRVSLPWDYRKLGQAQQQIHLSRQDGWRAQWHAQLQQMEGDLLQVYLDFADIGQAEKIYRHKWLELQGKLRTLKAQQRYANANLDSLWQEIIQTSQTAWETRRKAIELRYQQRLCYARLQRLYLPAPESKVRP